MEPGYEIVDDLEDGDLPGNVFVGAALTAMTVTGQSRGEPVADFTVDTAQGPLSMASQKGNILIYFFSFPG